eukprot:6184840-Pleurochrysis_carterae.AAC.2
MDAYVKERVGQPEVVGAEVGGCGGVSRGGTARDPICGGDHGAADSVRTRCEPAWQNGTREKDIEGRRRRKRTLRGCTDRNRRDVYRGWGGWDRQGGVETRTHRQSTEIGEQAHSSLHLGAPLNSSISVH